MLKKLLITTLFVCLLTLPVISEDLSFNSYLDAYIAAFTDIADTQEMYKEAALAYEGALARNASAIELEILLSAKERKAIDIRDITNQAVIDAFSLYSQFHEYSKAAQLYEARLKVARESIKNDESQYSLGLISETEYLTKKLSLHTTYSNLISNQRKLEDVERKIRRVLGDKISFIQAPVLDASTIHKSLTAVTIETALNGNAQVFTAKTNLSINEKVWKVISSSSYANDLEKKDAAEKFKQSQKTYKKSLESLEDACIDTERTIHDLGEQLERFNISKRITEISSDSTSLRKTYGKATELELLIVSNERQAKLDEITQFAYKLVQIKLEYIKLANGDCSAYIRGVITD